MNKRCIAIMELINQNGNLPVTELSERLDVSAVTIRKDLSCLEEQGLLRRQHGRALRVSPNDVGYRMTFSYDIKRRIAKKASEMVASGETIMIESGSTCAMLALELCEKRRDIRILTNSVFIADYVRKVPGAHVVLLGGSYDPDAQVTSGPLVKLCAQAFYVDKFFIGTDGFDPALGFTNVELLRAEAVRAMAESARNVIVLTEASKFNKRGVVSLVPPEGVSMVVANSIPDNCREVLESAGVEVVLA